jgi:hypothetical protein
MPHPSITPPPSPPPRVLLPLAGALILAILGSGCRENMTPHPTAPDELRGELIRAPVSDVPGPASPARSNLFSFPGLHHAGEDEPLWVGFDALSGYEFDETAAAPDSTDARNTSQVPEEILALDGREVAVKGFMLPLTFQGGLVTELLLMRDQSLCCFGVIPRINDWIHVSLQKPGVKAALDQPVTLLGTLHVGELYDNEILTSIYRMDGHQLIDALDL